MTAGVLAVVNWVLGLDGPTILGYATAGLVAVGVFFLIPNLKVRYALFALFIVAASFAVIRAYQDAQEYAVNDEGLILHPTVAPAKPGEPVTLQKIEISVAFDNPNNFPVTMRSIRAYTSVARQVTGGMGGDAEMPIPAHKCRSNRLG